jgi:ubiquinone/menaquinone biosynthesis C-methylase UbiE/DNA-binding transcriptional ArsR family regulator
MNRSTPQPESLLAWMNALGDDTRLRLLRLLEDHELGVVELCDILQLPQSTVSRHLKVLADGGWVDARRQATTHLYRATLDQVGPAARRLWQLARDQTDDWATLAQDQLRLQRVLHQRSMDSQTFFAGAAAQWDKLRRDLYGEHFSTAAMLALLDSHMVVADLGCGTGSISAALAPHVAQVFAVDNSPAMVKAATKRLSHHSNVVLTSAELETLPMPDGTCDAALLVLVLSYVTDPAAVLTQAHRILKPKGKLVIVDLLPHDRDDFRRQMGQQVLGFAENTLRSMVSAAGFGNVHFSPLPPEPAAKGPALFLAAAAKC